jgi:phosphogluconate dehydratase
MPDTTPTPAPAALHPIVLAVTRRIVERSAATRSAYLAQLAHMAERKPGADRMGCANVAHAFAAMPEADKTRVTGLDKLKIVAEKGANIGIVNAYNDLLSAHAPLQHYPDLIKAEARKHPRHGVEPVQPRRHCHGHCRVAEPRCV